MTKSAKELAFLRDLYVSGDWTERFTNIFDEHFSFSDEKRVLYLNAGTGNHALALREKLDQKSEIHAVCENEELQHIAQAKADAIKAKIEFTTDAPARKFDAVFANASFVLPKDIHNFVQKIADYSTKDVIFFLPTAGSFGEIFSFLWETFFNLDLVENGAEVERLISELPTVSQIEQTMQKCGLKQVKSFIKNEIFEFENGAEFINSPLIDSFLLPHWLSFLTEKEREKVSKKLVQTIDEDDGTMSFRFSVKATLVSGTK
jgi:uncharacterized FlaG/YvyC family protein